MKYNFEQYKNWQVTQLLCANLFVLFALLNWAAYPLRIFWIKVDAALFLFLQKSLLAIVWLKPIIIFTNSAVFVWGLFLILIATLLLPKGLLFAYRFSQRLMFLSLFIVAIAIMWYVVDIFFQLQRMSPIMALETDHVSPALIEQIKQASAHFSQTSGKLIMFSLLYSLYVLFHADKKWWLLVVIILLLSCIPGLTMGGMWLTDIIIAGLAAAVFAYASLILTPLMQWAVSLVKTKELTV